MAQRGSIDPNLALAAQAGESIANLFAGRHGNNALRSKYALEAAQRNSYDAQARERYAEAEATDFTTDTRRRVSDPALYRDDPRLQANPNPNMADIVAAGMGLGGNAEQMMKAINTYQGGAIMAAPEQTEGGMRQGYALTGQDAPTANAMTQGGITALFGQEASLNNADNATEVQKANITAAAARYGHDRDYAADVYGDELQYGEGGSVDRTTQTHYGPGGASDRAVMLKEGGAAGGAKAPKPLSASEVKSIGDQIAMSLGSAQYNAADIPQAAQAAAAIYARTGDVAGAISAATAMFYDNGTAEDEKGNPIPVKAFSPVNWIAPGTPTPAGLTKPGQPADDSIAAAFRFQGDVPPEVQAAIQNTRGGDFHVQIPPAKPAAPAAPTRHPRQGTANYGGRQINVIKVSTPAEAQAAWESLPKGWGLQNPSNGAIRYKE